jgi:hypothetical protein
MKLMGLVVMTIVTIFTARECDSNISGASQLDPANIARTGVAGVCADQQAAAAAGSADGDTSGSPGTVASPSELNSAGVPGGAQALLQALGGNLSCPTSTTAAGGN